MQSGLFIFMLANSAGAHFVCHAVSLCKEVASEYCPSRRLPEVLRTYLVVVQVVGDEPHGLHNSHSL